MQLLSNINPRPLTQRLRRADYTWTMNGLPLTISGKSFRLVLSLLAIFRKFLTDD